MRVRRVLTVGALCLLLTLECLLTAGCGNSRQTEPDLSSLGKIEAVTREDGSGTRDQFESLVGIDKTEAGKTVSSTDDVIREVEQNTSAIGYAAMSALPDTSSVKILRVGGVSPSEKTVRSRKYPLCRNYYLAWIGEQNDLEKEFLTFVKSAGQKIVAENAVPTAKETSFLSLKPAGKLTITGSTSMEPMMEKLAAEYKTYNPNADIEVKASDSTQGLRDAMQGRCDLAMSSRELKDYEKEILSSDKIAADGIVILVNKENALSDIQISELRSIFSGNIAQWKELYH